MDTTLELVWSTDHLSFIAAGVPGFNPVQDYVNYDVRTHHTNMDMAERVNIDDIRKAALVMAVFAYSAATTVEKMRDLTPSKRGCQRGGLIKGTPTRRSTLARMRRIGVAALFPQPR